MPLTEIGRGKGRAGDFFYLLRLARRPRKKGKRKEGGKGQGSSRKKKRGSNTTFNSLASNCRLSGEEREKKGGREGGEPAKLRRKLGRGKKKEEQSPYLPCTKASF